MALDSGIEVDSAAADKLQETCRGEGLAHRLGLDRNPLGDSTTTVEIDYLPATIVTPAEVPGCTTFRVWS